MICAAYEISEDSLVLDSALASELARLPLTCYNQEYPYKDGYVVENATQFKHSKENHPIFYGNHTDFLLDPIVYWLVISA